MSGKVDDGLSSIALALGRSDGLILPVILCFFTGHAPEYASPMPRSPAPEAGMTFGENFGDILADALRQNQAVHDGAVMLGRPARENKYRVSGWSYRLHPPAISISVVNKGSAFNSCLAMSCLTGVDALFLIAREGTFKFCEGEIAKLTD